MEHLNFVFTEWSDRPKPSGDRSDGPAISYVAVPGGGLVVATAEGTNLYGADGGVTRIDADGRLAQPAPAPENIQGEQI